MQPLSKIPSGSYFTILSILSHCFVFFKQIFKMYLLTVVLCLQVYHSQVWMFFFPSFKLSSNFYYTVILLYYSRLQMWFWTIHNILTGEKYSHWEPPSCQLFCWYIINVHVYLTIIILKNLPFLDIGSLVEPSLLIAHFYLDNCMFYKLCGRILADP